MDSLNNLGVEHHNPLFCGLKIDVFLKFFSIGVMYCFGRFIAEIGEGVAIHHPKMGLK